MTNDEEMRQVVECLECHEAFWLADREDRCPRCDSRDYTYETDKEAK